MELYEIKNDKWYNGYFVRGYNECVSDVIMPLLHEQVNMDGHFQFKKISDKRGNTMLEIRNQSNTNNPFILVGSIPPDGSTDKPRLKTIYKTTFEEFKDDTRDKNIAYDIYTGATYYPYLWLKPNPDIDQSNPKNQVYISFFYKTPFIMKDINPENGEFMVKEGSIMNGTNIRTPLSIRYYPITGACKCPVTGEGMGCDLRELFSNYHDMAIPEKEKEVELSTATVEIPKVEKKDDEEEDSDKQDKDNNAEEEGDSDKEEDEEIKDESFWDKYKWWFIGSISAFIIFVIIWMIMSRSKQSSY